MKTCLMALHLLFTPLAQAQVEMADNLRAEGKIYVIVLIILIVLAGLFAYLFLLERKIKKLEERLK
jgi:hypothetical protein